MGNVFVIEYLKIAFVEYCKCVLKTRVLLRFQGMRVNELYASLFLMY